MPQAKKANISIHRATIEALGGQELLDKAIEAYSQALKDHAKTVDVPAPTAHPWVEQVVRQSAGKYMVIEPEPEVVPEEPEKSFEELQAEAFKAIKFHRFDAIAKARVKLHGASFAANADALNALIAADMEASASDATWRRRWRVGAGSFVLIDHNDVRTLIGMVREAHQAAFTKEYELSEAILSAGTPKKLAKIDLESGWGE